MTEASTNASSETVVGAPSGEAVSIRAVAPEGPLVGVMDGSARWEIPVLDHGFVALGDVMPRRIPEGKTADSAIVQAARVSYGDWGCSSLWPTQFLHGSWSISACLSTLF